MRTYTIAPGDRSITCHRCGRTSYNLEDVANLYCGACHRFHDDSELAMWAVYDHPADYPDCFVARLFRFERPTGIVIPAPTLASLRDELAIRGLTPLQRDPRDDPVIVEVWI
jgi:hypothetical protein